MKQSWLILLATMAVAGMIFSQVHDLETHKNIETRAAKLTLDVDTRDSLMVESTATTTAPLTYTAIISDIAWIGDDGRGQISHYNGNWDFDYLSDEQRQPASAPQGGNTVFWVPGDVVDAQGWAHSYMTSSLPFAAVYDLAELGLPDDDMGALAKGGLAFFNPDTGSYLPGSMSAMMSPPIYPEEFGLEPTPEWLLRFDVYASPQAAETITMLVGMRYDLGGGVWSDWINQDIPLQSGSQTVTVNFSDQVPPQAVGVQVQVGAKNNTQEEVQDPGPMVDNVQVGNKKGEAAVTFKGIPDIDQKQPYETDDTSEKAQEYWKKHPDRKDGICQAGAYANCLWYWDNNGYDDLVPDTDNDAQDAATIKEELAKEIYDEEEGFNTGVTEYLKGKKAYYDKKENPKGLIHVMVQDKHATWQYLKKQIEACNDVLLSVTWYKENGDQVDDLHHWMTLAGKQDPDADGKGKIHVSNPWGEYRGVGKDSYDAMDVQVDPTTGRIKIKDKNLINNVQGSDDAAYCMVDDIAVIRKGPPGKLVKGEYLVGKSHVSIPQALTNYRYTITNTDSISMYHFMLFVTVPYTNVVSPPGWNWTALPGYLPGYEGRPNRSTGSSPGILWTTTSDPIQLDQILNGFGFSADDSYPTQDDGLLYIVLAEASMALEHGIVFGPVQKDVTVGGTMKILVDSTDNSGGPLLLYTTLAGVVAAAAIVIVARSAKRRSLR